MTVRARASASTSRGAAPAPARVTRQVPSESYTSVTPYFVAMMLRNFATDTWQFKAEGRVSAPGCVIASPSRSGDAVTDQDYVNSWVRDSALCVREVAHVDFPFARAGLLDEYVTFSRNTQQAAKSQGREGLACFHIDGTLRDWTIQSDGPALRVTAVLDFFDKLSPAGQVVAKELVEDDLRYLLGAYRSPTFNLWEESQGYHFFTRAVQKHCFERVLAAQAALGIDVDATEMRAAAKELGERLEDHWTGDHYRSTVDGSGPGGDVDASTLMGAVYGELPATAPRLLSTAAVLWDSFRDLYPINDADVAQGFGPMIGRYPEDTYDGDVAEPPNIGHPWPVCTALFAQYYYTVADQLDRDGRLSVDATTRRFYEQIGVTPADGDYPAGSAEFTGAQDALRAAADRMLGAVLHHSDFLELSEQYDRYTGFEKSVRNLTWSYGAFLSAVRAKGRN